MKAIGKDGYIQGVALFFELTDELLERVKKDARYFYDEDFVKKCYASKGKHAHIFSLYSDYKSTKEIADGMRKLIADYKSLSWWDKDTKKFIMIGGK